MFSFGWIEIKLLYGGGLVMSKEEIMFNFSYLKRCVKLYCRCHDVKNKTKQGPVNMYDKKYDVTCNRVKW